MGRTIHRIDCGFQLGHTTLYMWHNKENIQVLVSKKPYSNYPILCSLWGINRVELWQNLKLHFGEIVLFWAPSLERQVYQIDLQGKRVPEANFDLHRLPSKEHFKDLTSFPRNDSKEWRFLWSATKYVGFETTFLLLKRWSSNQNRSFVHSKTKYWIQAILIWNLDFIYHCCDRFSKRS